jgi:hypothetical protein
MSVASEGIWFPIADSPPPHNPIGYQPTNNIQPIINAHETSSESVGNPQPSIHPGYWSPIGSQAKATTLYGLYPWSLTGYEPVGHVIWSRSCFPSFPVHDRQLSVT